MPVVEGHAAHVIHFHVRLLVEAGLLQAFAETRAPTRDWLALRLTWQGYDYLETIRDPAVWRHARRAALKAGGWSLETIGAIAKAAILAKAQSLGIDIGA